MVLISHEQLQRAMKKMAIIVENRALQLMQNFQIMFNEALKSFFTAEYEFNYPIHSFTYWKIVIFLIRNLFNVAIFKCINNSRNG